MSAFLVRLVELVLAGGAAYLLDDGAARMTAVTPRTRLAAPCSGARGWADRAGGGVGRDPAGARSAGLPAVGGGPHRRARRARRASRWRSPRSWCGAATRSRGVGSRRSWGSAGITALIAEPLLRASIFLPADGGARRLGVAGVVGGRTARGGRHPRRLPGPREPVAPLTSRARDRLAACVLLPPGTASTISSWRSRRPATTRRWSRPASGRPWPVRRSSPSWCTTSRRSTATRCAATSRWWCSPRPG